MSALKYPAPPAARQRGVAAVEFALLIIPLLLIAAGLSEFGRGLWYHDALAKSTRDAARYLSTVPLGELNGSLSQGKTMVVAAASAARVAGLSADQVTISCAPTPCSAANKSGDVSSITVAVRYPLTLGSLFPFLANDADGLRASTYAVELQPRTTMPYLW